MLCGRGLHKINFVNYRRTFSNQSQQTFIDAETSFRVNRITVRIRGAGNYNSVGHFGIMVKASAVLITNNATHHFSGSAKCPIQ